MEYQTCPNHESDFVNRRNFDDDKIVLVQGQIHIKCTFLVLLSSYLNAKVDLLLCFGCQLYIAVIFLRKKGEKIRFNLRVFRFS